MYFLFQLSFYLLHTRLSLCWLSCNNSLVNKVNRPWRSGKGVFGTWFAYSAIYLLCQNDLDLFQQIRASILHIRLSCDYSTGSPRTKSHWVPSSHLTLETELTCKSLIWGRGAGGAGAYLKFKSKNAQCSMQWLPKRVLHIVWALYHVYIVVQVTMNMAEYAVSLRMSLLDQL